MNINYGIMAVTPDDLKVRHFVGYTEEPSAYDYIALYQELKEDEELGMVGVEFVLMPASKDIIEEMIMELHDI